MAGCDAQHLGRISPPVMDASNVAGPVSAGPDAGVPAPSDARVRTQSDACVRAQPDTHVGAQSDTHVGAQSNTRVGSLSDARVGALSDARVGALSDARVGASSGSAEGDAMAPDECSVAQAKATFIERAPGPSGDDAGIAAPRADQPALHAGAAPSQTAQDRRARQDVPPAVRRAVMRRDGGRCVVPGCKHGVVDLHHIELRSEGGDHDPDALIVLCGAHHRALHRGQIIIDGRVSTGLTFRHADGTRYGAVTDPRVVDAHLQAFQALRSLGFREGETRRALEQVRADPLRSGDASMEGILRAALSVLAAAPRPRP
jgi:RuvA, C-terminal domain